MMQLVLLALVFQIQTHATPVNIPMGFMTGEQYLKGSEAERAGYAAGFVNGLYVAPLLTTSAQQLTSKLGACMGGRTNTQAAEIIRKYISDRPERWNNRLNILSFEALLRSCPAN